MLLRLTRDLDINRGFSHVESCYGSLLTEPEPGEGRTAWCKERGSIQLDQAKESTAFVSGVM